jgi:hypothetical protein
MTSGERFLVMYGVVTCTLLLIAAGCKDFKRILGWHNTLTDTQTPAEMRELTRQWWHKHVDPNGEPREQP